VFRFTTHPALIGVTDGVQIAFAYLQATWRKWLPMVALIAACAFVVYLIVGTVNTADLYYVDRYTGNTVWSEPELRKYLTGILAAGAVVGLVTLVASWVFYATAVAGLRNRPVTLENVVVRGLLFLVAGILMGVVAVVAILALIIVTVIVTVLIPPLGILLILILAFAAIPVALYLEARLILTGMAIFDGFGPIDGIKESWRLSNGAVLRLLGWGVMAWLISLAFGIVAAVVSTPFSIGGLTPVGQAFSAGVTAVASCLTTYMVAVVYESQRARLDPTLYGPPPAPAYFGYPGPGPTWPAYQGTPPAWPGAQGTPPAWPGAPGTPPPGFYPGPNAAGPSWPGAPGTPPAWPGAPGTPPAWPGAPGTPPAWPGAPGTPPAWPGAPANPTAIPGWVNPNAAPAWPPSAQGDAPPPSAPKPPEPPASS